MNLEGLSEDFPELMATMAEVVQTPGFAADQFALLAERRRAELVHQQDDPREMANIRYLRLFFGDSPYGHAVPGELPRLDNIGVADLGDRREFTPATSTLVVVGMEADARVKEEAARLWGNWTGAARPARLTLRAPECLSAPGDLSPGPARPDPERNPGRASGDAPGPPRLLPPEAGELYPGRRRLFLPPSMARIRSDLGFTYGIRSSFSCRRAPGPFIVNTFTPAANTAQVVDEIRAVITEVHQNGVTDQELAEAQSYYVGHFPWGWRPPGGSPGR